MTNNRNFIHIEILRTLALLSVILFHTAVMLINKTPHTESIDIWPAITYGSSLLVGIGVPLFMFMAGYLYKPVLKSQITSFIRKKALRLWVPYLIFTILIMISSGFFDFRAIWEGRFWHLWFLPSLFWCFIISILIDYRSKWALMFFPFSIVCSLIPLPAFLGIQDFTGVFPFFVLGALIKYHPHSLIFLKRYRLSIPLACFYIFVNLLIPFHYRNPSLIHSISISAIILSIWCFIDNSSHLQRSGVYFFSIGICSMGIYILHYWILIYLLSSTSFRIFNLSTFMHNYPLTTFIVLVAATFIICYAITLLLRKYKWGRFLLGETTRN